MISLLLGGVFGWSMPVMGKQLDIFVSIYMDILKMIVLPFMVSAVIFSLNKVSQSEGGKSLMRRSSVVFGYLSVIFVVVGLLTVVVLKPGTDLTDAQRESLGQIIAQDDNQGNDVFDLHSADDITPSKNQLSSLIEAIVPSNIFASLSKGEALKILVFCVFFGLAVSRIPLEKSQGLTSVLETIYKSCQVLTRWMNIPLAWVLFCTGASQVAMGSGSISVMLGFVVAFALACVVLLVVSVVIIRSVSQVSVVQTLAHLREMVSIAIATRSSISCMPAMIDALEQLKLPRLKVELLVPLTVSLLRLGPMVYYICATVFIAQIYGRVLTADEYGLLIVASIIIGFSSTGLSGILAISLVGATCAYIKIPYEAILILLISVDPICDVFRTLLLVVGNSAAVTLICRHDIDRSLTQT